MVVMCQIQLGYKHNAFIYRANMCAVYFMHVASTSYIMNVTEGNAFVYLVMRLKTIGFCTM